MGKNVLYYLINTAQLFLPYPITKTLKLFLLNFY